MMKKEPAPNKAFGYQYLLDFYKCSKNVCDDLNLCYDFLNEVVDKLKMQKQSPPVIYRSDAIRFPDKAGLSGWVPLIESSVVIHTLSVKDFISIDIYSCKKFDPKLIRPFCEKYFHPKKVEEHFLERGEDYYKTNSNYHSLHVHKGKLKHFHVKKQ